MTRTQTMVQLTEELVELLDLEAQRRRVSRSALIREVLEDHLREDRETLIGQQIAAGYKRLPPRTPEAWGDLEPLTDTATTDLLQRLDAEESAAGQEPW